MRFILKTFILLLGIFSFQLSGFADDGFANCESKINIGNYGSLDTQLYEKIKSFSDKVIFKYGGNDEKIKRILRILSAFSEKDSMSPQNLDIVNFLGNDITCKLKTIKKKNKLKVTYPYDSGKSICVGIYDGKTITKKTYRKHVSSTKSYDYIGKYEPITPAISERVYGGVQKTYYTYTCSGGKFVHYPNYNTRTVLECNSENFIEIDKKCVNKTNLNRYVNNLPKIDGFVIKKNNRWDVAKAYCKQKGFTSVDKIKYETKFVDGYITLSRTNLYKDPEFISQSIVGSFEILSSLECVSVKEGISIGQPYNDGLNLMNNGVDKIGKMKVFSTSYGLELGTGGYMAPKGPYLLYNKGILRKSDKEYCVKRGYEEAGMGTKTSTVGYYGQTGYVGKMICQSKIIAKPIEIWKTININDTNNFRGCKVRYLSNNGLYYRYGNSNKGTNPGSYVVFTWEEKDKGRTIYSTVYSKDKSMKFIKLVYTNSGKIETFDTSKGPAIKVMEELCPSYMQ